MVTHGSVKGTKLLWISKAAFWFGLGTFWSLIHFSEECKKQKKIKNSSTCYGNSSSEHIHGW